MGLSKWVLGNVMCYIGKLRAFGFTYPGAHRKNPRPGHDDLAINNKTLAYLSKEGEPFSFSIKLPYSKHEC
jgi:hypothetical protein